MNKEKQKFTLGFIFNKELDRVLLLKKNIKNTSRTENLIKLLDGKLNGVGGEIDPGETPLDCIVRECKEETNLDIKDWIKFVELDAKFGYIYCYYVATDEIYNYKQLEDEKMGIFSISNKFNDCFKNFERIYNMDWMIKMALNHYKKLDSAEWFKIEEIYE